MKRDANEVTRALLAVRELWASAEREVAFELARWALQLGKER